MKEAPDTDAWNYARSNRYWCYSLNKNMGKTFGKSLNIIVGCLFALWFLRTFLKSLLVGNFTSLNLPGAALTLIVTGGISYVCFKSAFTPDANTPASSSGCLKSFVGAVLGATLGAIAAMAWLYFNPPFIPPQTDGLERYGGQMALVMLGILLGGLSGACIGAVKSNK